MASPAVDQDDGGIDLEEMETSVSQDPMSQIPWHERPVDQDGSGQPQMTLPQTQPKKVTIDSSREQQKLLEIILKAVVGGHKGLIEKALEALEKCDIQQHPVGTQVLDFILQKDSSARIYVPVEYSCHSPLMIACEKDREDLVGLLLDNGASAAFRNKDKLNALHIASKRGNKAIVDLLLAAAFREKRFAKGKKLTSDHQWIINGRNDKGWNPLMFAIDGGHIDVIRRLIETGQVDYLAKTRKQWNILHIACRQPNIECVKEVFSLTENNPDLATKLVPAIDKGGWNLLHHGSANTKNKEILKWLLTNISEENLTSLINQQNKVGYTPLLTACEYQNTEAVRLLLDKEADVTLCAMDGLDDPEGKKSGLHIAAIHDAREITELLLEKKCPVDTKDSEGNSALHVAFKKSSFEVIAILRQKDDGKLEALTNKAGKLARNITPDDIIPPEIKKRGKEAIDLYKKALKEGKKKIPRCNLLILGQERVGKTSVYRLLVGLGFKADQQPTKGIDNNDVDTLDKRCVDIKHWKERKEEEQMKQSEKQFAKGVANELHDTLPQKKGPRKILPVYQDQLMREIQNVEREIKLKKEEAEIKRKKEEASRQAVEELTNNLQSLEISHPTVQPVEHQAPPIQSTAPIVPQTPIKDDPKPRLPPQTGPTESDSVTRQEPTPKVVQQPTKPASTEHPPQEASAAVTEEPITQPERVQAEELQTRTFEPRVNRKHCHSINQELKSGKKQVKEEPSLILNTLDFAGQPEYRPMHHCFITRRGMYLVVFNLQDMVNDGGLTKISLEEIRYWIHSIHAHIYPPDKSERGKDEKMRRICLVGTHRAPKNLKQGREITKDELKAIDNLLRKELLSDDRCVDHIHCMEGSKWIFVAVENSIDGKKDDDRTNSGASLLQKQLGDISEHLAFLQEDYPIVWLQFESELMRQREYRKNPERSESMVISLGELQSWALYQGITSPEAQNVAFQFFHDTGRIVYLKQTPTLFLNEEECQQLTDLVILDPAWLIKVMKVIFEMDQSFKGVPGRMVQQLLTCGIASSSLLKACWKKFTDTGPASFKQLCLMLQANCLIYPVPSLSISESCPQKAETDPLPAGDSPPLAAPTRSQTGPEATAADEKESFFLVPSKLPEKPTKDPKLGGKSQWIEFYFDFQKFLPNEIYHRLICLMLAVSESTKKPTGKRKKNIFYSTCCQFYNIDGCKWKIELEKDLYMLKVSVLSKSDKIPPSYFIKKVHTEYLLKICQASHLQGLEYYGGPFVKCANCGEEEIVEYVGYAHGEPQKPPCDDLECTQCDKKHADINELLKPKVSTEPSEPTMTTAVGSSDSPERSRVSRSLVEVDSSNPVEQDGSRTTQDTKLPPTTASAKDRAIPSIPSTQPSSSKPPTLKTLTIIKWKDEKGVPQKSLRIIGTVSPKWREAGRMLEIEGPNLETISMKHRENPVECCCEIFTMWLDGACSDDYPVRWAGLTELLVDLQLQHVADNLQKALNINKV